MMPTLLLSPEVLMIDFEQIKPKKKQKMLKSVQKYNTMHFNNDDNIEDDEDKGLPVKLFPEANTEENQQKIEEIMELHMNDKAMNWILREATGKLPKNKRELADERGLRDRKKGEKDDDQEEQEDNDEDDQEQANEEDEDN